MWDEESFARATASKPSVDSFEFLADFDCEASDVGVVKSLVNQSSYAGKQLSTKAAVPANIHREQFRDFWL